MFKSSTTSLTLASKILLLAKVFLRELIILSFLSSLRELGVEEGESVFIGEYEFEFFE